MRHDRPAYGRSRWLWGAASLVLVAGVTGLVVAARRDEPYQGGSSGMIVGAAR